MAIIYQCRHCNQEIGRLEEQVLEASRLGLNRLTAEEKAEMVEYLSNGDLQISAICDACEETLMTHPHYHELDYFIH